MMLEVSCNNERFTISPLNKTTLWRLINPKYQPKYEKMSKLNVNIENYVTVVIVIIILG